MVFETLNFITARNLGINYIPCCKIVLMFYNIRYLQFKKLNKMKNTEHIEKINQYIGKCLSNGLMNHADLIEIFKHNQHHTRLVRVSQGVHSPQYYYQNDKVITLLGAKFVINEPPPIC